MNLYYSTNTYLAYYIAREYYENIHYVWCSPVFNPAVLDSLNPHKNIPPSSSPFAIYWDLYESVKRNDRHSSKIKDNKNGLIRGAGVKLKDGVITQEEHLTITNLINSASINDFRPLLYLIDIEKTASLVRTVKIKDRAHPLGQELRIEELPHRCFHNIELKNV